MTISLLMSTFIVIKVYRSPFEIDALNKKIKKIFFKYLKHILSNLLFQNIYNTSYQLFWEMWIPNTDWPDSLYIDSWCTVCVSIQQKYVKQNMWMWIQVNSWEHFKQIKVCNHTLNLKLQKISRNPPNWCSSRGLICEKVHLKKNYSWTLPFLAQFFAKYMHGHGDHEFRKAHNWSSSKKINRTATDVKSSLNIFLSYDFRVRISSSKHSAKTFNHNPGSIEVTNNCCRSCRKIAFSRRKFCW